MDELHRTTSAGRRGRRPGAGAPGPVRSAGRLGILGALGLLAACYTYQPVAEPTPGAQVRAHLTMQGALQQSEVLGEPFRVIDGSYVGRLQDDALEIAVVRARGQSVFEDFTFRQRLVIEPQQIEGLEQRQLSGWRTGLVGAGIAAVAWFAIDRAVDAGGNSGNGGGPGPVASVTIPFPGR